MNEPDFLKSPFERIAQILTIALNPDASAEARAKACEELKRLPEKLLRALALDSDWQHIQALLDGEDVEDMPGDGPWTHPQPIEGVYSNVPRAEPESMPPFELYFPDIHELMRHDYHWPPALIETLITTTASPIERAVTSAAATTNPIRPTGDQLRKLAWSMLNHGEALWAIGESWPNQPQLIEVFMEECVTQRVHRGIPPRLGIHIEHLIVERPTLQQWFASVVDEIDSYLDAEIFDFLQLESLVEHHVSLRVGVAHAVRMAEITCPSMVAAMELFATVALLRTCANQDVVRCWQESKGDPTETRLLYKRLNRENKLLFAKAFQAVTQKPDEKCLKKLSMRDREALNWSYELQRRATRHNNTILITAITNEEQGR